MRSMARGVELRRALSARTSINFLSVPNAKRLTPTPAIAGTIINFHTEQDAQRPMGGMGCKVSDDNGRRRIGKSDLGCGSIICGFIKTGSESVRL